MAINVYLVSEVRNIGNPKATVDIYKICPTFDSAIAVYMEKVGEPKSIREDDTGEGMVWWLDETGTGSAQITRYTLDGNHIETV